jgi:hypothetical protein
MLPLFCKIRYSTANWKEDLRRLFRKTGVDALPTLFLLDDAYFDEDILFEDLNTIMQDGDVNRNISIQLDVLPCFSTKICIMQILKT